MLSIEKISTNLVRSIGRGRDDDFAYSGSSPLFKVVNTIKSVATLPLHEEEQVLIVRVVHVHAPSSFNPHHSDRGYSVASSVSDTSPPLLPANCCQQ